MADEIAVPVKKHSMLPVLIILFLLAYGMMAMLIVEQGNTIESQKLLIRQLFSDSAQLSALKGKAAREKAAAGASKTQPAPPAAPQQQPKPETPPVASKPRPNLDTRQVRTADVRRMLVSI